MARRERTPAVKDRWAAALIGVAIGVPMFLLEDFGFPGQPRSTNTMFGSISSWPHWLQFFWPFQLALMIVYVATAAFMFIKVADPHVPKWQMVRISTLGVGASFGCLIAGGDWVIGLQVAAVAAVSLLLIILTVMGIMGGAAAVRRRLKRSTA
ncbi:MAG TPA: hypothetical protein VLF91_02455 [Candidatus Saccharimonadales bacterium]|nr:hypothetical protein [Candidatus Saccharimonadales bacterium]